MNVIVQSFFESHYKTALNIAKIYLESDSLPSLHHGQIQEHCTLRKPFHLDLVSTLKGMRPIKLGFFYIHAHLGAQWILGPVNLESKRHSFTMNFTRARERVTLASHGAFERQFWRCSWCRAFIAIPIVITATFSVMVVIILIVIVIVFTAMSTFS